MHRVPDNVRHEQLACLSRLRSRRRPLKWGSEERHHRASLRPRRSQFASCSMAQDCSICRPRAGRGRCDTLGEASTIAGWTRSPSLAESEEAALRPRRFTAKATRPSRFERTGGGYLEVLQQACIAAAYRTEAVSLRGCDVAAVVAAKCRALASSKYARPRALVGRRHGLPTWPRVLQPWTMAAWRLSRMFGVLDPLAPRARTRRRGRSGSASNCLRWGQGQAYQQEVGYKPACSDRSESRAKIVCQFLTQPGTVRSVVLASVFIQR